MEEACLVFVCLGSVLVIGDKGSLIEDKIFLDDLNPRPFADGPEVPLIIHDPVLRCVPEQGLSRNQLLLPLHTVAPLCISVARLIQTIARHMSPIRRNKPASNLCAM